MKLKKLTACLTALAMTFGGMSLPVNAETVKQSEDINLTIDKRTVTVEEAKNGVLIYIRLDTPLVNAIEFGTHVDDRCSYIAISDADTLSYVPENAAQNGEKEALDIKMSVLDSTVVQNMTWYVFAQTHPDLKQTSLYLNGDFDCMNLAALYVTIPEEYAVPGAHFDIEYLAKGATRPDGNFSKSVWKNTYQGTASSSTIGRSFDFERQDYLDEGIFNAQGGWIEIATAPSTIYTTTTTTTTTTRPTTTTSTTITTDRPTTTRPTTTTTTTTTTRPTTTTSTTITTDRPTTTTSTTTTTTRPTTITSATTTATTTRQTTTTDPIWWHHDIATTTSGVAKPIVPTGTTTDPNMWNDDIATTTSEVAKPIVPTGTTTDPDYWNWHGGGDSTSTTAVSSQPQKDFSYVVQSDHIVITEFSKTVTEIVIPSQIDYLPVTEIGNGAFQNATKLKKITLPDTIVSIGDSAFYNATALESITLPKNLESIGDYAFYKCISLHEITFPENLADVGEYAFSGCVTIQSANISGTMVTLPDGCFLGCSSLTRISIPLGITNLNNNTSDNSQKERATFYKCPIQQVYYEGTQVQWDAVELKGDVNSADIYCGSGSQEETITPDLNGDGKINSIDAAIILQYAAYVGGNGHITIGEYLAKTKN